MGCVRVSVRKKERDDLNMCPEKASHHPQGTLE